MGVSLFYTSFSCQYLTFIFAKTIFLGQGIECFNNYASRSNAMKKYSTDGKPKKTYYYQWPS